MKIINKEIYSKGRRGLVYLADYKGKKIILKEKNPDSESPGRIEIEAIFLKKLNKHDIGPKLYFFKDNSLGMEFIDGVLFEKYLKTSTKEKIMKVITDILNQLFIMDKLKITKEEMHHPVKHIIIRDDRPVMIDFERCHYTEKPKNVTQFIQYMTGDRIKNLLKEKNILINTDVLSLVKAYKESVTEDNFKKIIHSIK
jgi:putative serine/threonine protein kinase